MEPTLRKCTDCKEDFLASFGFEIQCITCWRKSMNKKEFHFGG